MKANATRHAQPPGVDEGNPRGLGALLRRELRPTPGRLGDSVRIVVVVLAVVAIAETFRIPDIAVSAYIVLFLSGREAASTMRTALAAGIAVVVAIFTTIAVFMLRLSEPALRIPLMAVMTFAAMFLSRASPLGPVFFVAGFVIAYGLTLGDEVLGLALQPATIGNAPQFERCIASGRQCAGDHRAEQLPPLAVEARHLDLLDWRKIGRAGVDRDPGNN